MTSFRYEAATSDGRTVKGMLDTTSRAAATSLLSQRGLFPVMVDVVTGEEQLGWRKPSRRDLAIVVQSLASLVEAGVPLEQALAATQELVTGQFNSALGRVTERVREGASLASAMEAETGLFAGVTVGLVRGGEQGVGLGPALIQAAEQLEKDAEQVARIRSALAYPILLAVVGLFSVGLISFFVVPRFAELVADANRALPAATRILLTTSNVLRSYGVLLVICIGLAAIAAHQWTVRFPHLWHRWLLEFPLVGKVRFSLTTARVCRTLGALFGTGTPALYALDVARNSVGDFAIAKRLTLVRESVSQGSALSLALMSEDAVTPEAARLVKIGEGSGQLSNLLLKAASINEQIAERRLKSLITILEPVLILALAALVAFVAAALLQAVYSVRPGGV